MVVVEPGTFQYQLFFALTGVILIVKAILAIYLGRRVWQKKKEAGKLVPDFLFGIFIFMISLFISRIFFAYFDFVLTQFDVDRYHLYPNVLYWKLGMFTSAIGIAITIFIMDKSVLRFKFKGILSYIIIAGAIFVVIYPVNTAEDFAFVSGISIFSMVGTLLIPILFIYIAIKTPGLRTVSLMITFGFIFYGVASLLVNEAILTQFRILFGAEIHILIFFLFMILKITGLSMVSYAVTKFGLR